jgi:hypothetical protein
MVREIPMLSVGQLKLYEKRAPKSAASGALWCGEHATTHNRIRVQQRGDRYLLISIYEQAAQIAIVRASRWGPLPETDAPNASVKTVSNDHPTIVAACAFVLPFAMSYAEDRYKSAHEMKKAMYTALRNVGDWAKDNRLWRPPPRTVEERANLGTHHEESDGQSTVAPEVQPAETTILKRPASSDAKVTIGACKRPSASALPLPTPHAQACAVQRRVAGEDTRAPAAKIRNHEAPPYQRRHTCKGAPRVFNASRVGIPQMSFLGDEIGDDDGMLDDFSE